MNDKQEILSRVPQVNAVLNDSRLAGTLADLDHDFVVSRIQHETEKLRTKVLSSPDASASRQDMVSEIVANTIEEIDRLLQPSLRKVVNGTGIILHTGLGRAPLCKTAQENLARIAQGYCNLELDLPSGKRGSRTEHIQEILCYLTHSEAACVVNNNAAAVLLVLNTLCDGKEAIVSRGQLVEIGGSFRVPDVMDKSGAIMREVGTTNKTHRQDYEGAISEHSGMICSIHPSNFRVQGFTKETHLPELVALGAQYNLPVFQDLGGGVMFDLRKHGLPYEPIAPRSIDLGCDVVTFSGDKVLGGPQAGIIIGRRKYIDRIKANPLMRALRCDKLTYAVLEATLKQYLSTRDVEENNFVFRILLEDIAEIDQRAERLKIGLQRVEGAECEIAVEKTVVQIGSGALPLEEIESRAVSFRPSRLSVDLLAKKFRMNTPPVVGYVTNDKLFFDVRTMLDGDDASVLSAYQCIAD